jgi:hypothetical protein
VVPIGPGRQNDHFFGIGFLRRSGIAPEAIVEGLPVRFNVQPSRRHEGKTEASDIEIVISEAARASSTGNLPSSLYRRRSADCCVTSPPL